MITTIDVTRSEYWQHVRYAARERLEILLRTAYGRRQQERIDTYMRARNAGPLSADTIAMLTQREGDEARGNLTKRLALRVTDADIARDPKPMQRRAAVLLRDLLNRRPAIRSVANIGARLDIVSEYLAPRFPDVQFTSVDFQPDLADYNAPLHQSPNWAFRTGYPLDVLRSELQPDCVLMTSTSVMINAAELHAYLEAIPKAKAVVVNEPWWQLSPWRITRPEDIRPDLPLCGGRYGQYHHNYHAAFERHGFAITTSRILDGSQGGAWTLQVIGERIT